MSKYLKGNYPLPHDGTPPAEKAEATPTEQFEREALRRLGGSIAFVAKKKFLYGLDGDEDKK